MTRNVYWSLILIPAFLLGMVSGFVSNDPIDFTAKHLIYILMAIPVPVLGFWRMQYLKFTPEEMILFCIPFVGMSIRRRFYSEK